MPRGPHEHRAWIWVSRYVRVRDADEDGYAQCPSHDKPYTQHVKYMQAGHVWPKGAPRYRALEFDVRFIRTQCGGCNGPRREDMEVRKRFEAFIRNLYGDEVVDNALMLARTGTRKVMGKIEADLLIEWCQLQIRELLIVKPNIERWW